MNYRQLTGQFCWPSLPLSVSSFVFSSIQLIFSILLQIHISEASSNLVCLYQHPYLCIIQCYTQLDTLYFSSTSSLGYLLTVFSHPRISFYLLSLCCQFSCQNIHLLICDWLPRYLQWLTCLTNSPSVWIFILQFLSLHAHYLSLFKLFLTIKHNSV